MKFKFTKLKVILTVALTVVLSVSMVLAVTLSVDELKQLVGEPIETFGAVPGPDVYNRMYFHAGFNDGGTVWATTTNQATYTWLDSDLDGDVGYIQILPNVNYTATTPATSSMSSMLGNIVGAKREYILHNASTTAASTITIAAGTGVDLQEDEGETVIINGLEFARLTFLRTGVQSPGGTGLSGGNGVTLIVEPFQVGD